MSSHYEPAPEDARRPIGHSVSDSLAASTDPDLPTVHADSVKLSADEDALLGIFRARVGQMLPAERLCEQLAEVRAARPAAVAAAGTEPLTEAEIAPMLRALDRKLKMAGAPEHIREVSGVGCVLWR
jgi:hypothetical protein